MADIDNTIDSDADDLSGTDDRNTHEDPKGRTEYKTSSSNNEVEEKLKELRRENAKYRTRAKDNEREAAEFKQLAEKAFKKIEELESSVNQKLLDAETKISEAHKKITLTEKANIHKILELEAKNAGVVDYELFATQVDIDSLKVSQTGEIEGVKELVQKIKESKPILFSTRTIKNTSNVHGIPNPATETRKDMGAVAIKDPAAYNREKLALINSYK